MKENKYILLNIDNFALSCLNTNFVATQKKLYCVIASENK